MAKLDENGAEILDPTPIALPVRFNRPPSLIDDIRRLVSQELSAVAVSQGHDSFEEDDDFEIPDDEPRSRFELPDHYPKVAGFNFNPPKPAVGDIQTSEGGGEKSPPQAAETVVKDPKG